MNAGRYTLWLYRYVSSAVNVDVVKCGRKFKFSCQCSSKIFILFALFAGVVGKILYCHKTQPYYEPYAQEKIDALWGDYLMHRYSLPELFSMIMNKDACVPTTDAEKKELVTIDFIHTIVDRPKERERQKVKITDVSVCLM